MPFLKIAATEVVSGVSGESEEKIRDLFEQAVVRLTAQHSTPPTLSIITCISKHVFKGIIETTIALTVFYSLKVIHTYYIRYT